MEPGNEPEKDWSEKGIGEPGPGVPGLKLGLAAGPEGGQERQRQGIVHLEQV